MNHIFKNRNVTTCCASIVLSCGILGYASVATATSSTEGGVSGDLSLTKTAEYTKSFTYPLQYSQCSWLFGHGFACPVGTVDALESSQCGSCCAKLILGEDGKQQCTQASGTFYTKNTGSANNVGSQVLNFFQSL